MKRITVVKSLPFELKSVDEQGIFTGYASVFDNVDLEGDIVQAGAFGIGPAWKDIAVGIFYNHDYGRPVGRNLQAREDEHGLAIKGKLTLGTRDGDDVYRFMLDGVLNRLSIGANVIQSKPRDGGGRLFIKLLLREYSVVPFPANELAEVTSVKRIDISKTSFEDALKEIEIWARCRQLMAALETSLDSSRWDTEKQKEDRITESEAAIDAFKQAYMQYLPEYIDMLDARYAMLANGDPVEIAKTLAEKAGRSLSGKNRNAIEGVMRILQEMLDSNKSAPEKPEVSGEDVRAIDALIARMRAA